MRRALTFCLLLLWTASLAAPAVHHFATSLTEADYNAETKRVEVALSVMSSDLEWVLSRRAGKRVSLEHTPKVDALLETYLNEVFHAKLKSGDTAVMTWVGKEFETSLVWLFFELDLPKGTQGVRLTNRVLMKWERDQINTVNLRSTGRNRTLTFDRQHATQPLDRERDGDED